MPPLPPSVVSPPPQVDAARDPRIQKGPAGGVEGDMPIHATVAISVLGPQLVRALYCGRHTPHGASAVKMWRAIVARVGGALNPDDLAASIPISAIGEMASLCSAASIQVTVDGKAAGPRAK